MQPCRHAPDGDRLYAEAIQRKRCRGRMLPLPLGLGREGEGRPAPRLARGPAPRRRHGPGGRPRQGRAESLLLGAIRPTEDGLEMPPKKPKLAPSVIAEFERWINQGAMAPSVSQTHEPGRPTAAEARRHWAFQPVKKPDVTRGPETRAWVKKSRRCLCPREAGIAWLDARAARRPSRLASPCHVRPDGAAAVAGGGRGVRRGQPCQERREEPWSIGCSPAPSATGSVGHAAGSTCRPRHAGSPKASRSMTATCPNRLACPSRDYVVASLNADKPFDRFLTEQLAGDGSRRTTPSARPPRFSTGSARSAGTPATLRSP